MPITLPDLGQYLTASDTGSPLAADFKEYFDTCIPYTSTTPYYCRFIEFHCPLTIKHQTESQTHSRQIPTIHHGIHL